MIAKDVIMSQPITALHSHHINAVFPSSLVSLEQFYGQINIDSVLILGMENQDWASYFTDPFVWPHAELGCGLISGTINNTGNEKTS